MDLVEHEERLPAPVFQHWKCVLPGNPSPEVVVLPGKQAQWSLNDLLGNLFETTCKESLHENYCKRKAVVEDIHRSLWPGQPLPDLVPSKHQELNRRPGDPQDSDNVYLKNKCLPTSLAFSWIVWAFSHSKRMASSRAKSWKFFHDLFHHCLEVAGSLEFEVSLLGQRNASGQTVEITSHNDTVDARLLWTRILHNRISVEWNSCRVQDSNLISSNLQRPRLLDIIFFALDYKNKTGYLLRPAAFSLLAQFAYWVDGNIRQISLKAAGYKDSLDKNRIDKAVALHHAIWTAIDYAFYENDACLCFGLGWLLYSIFGLPVKVYLFMIMAPEISESEFTNNCP